MIMKSYKNDVKRVATFYRVSTKKQLDHVSDGNTDILSQQIACKEFIERQLGWKLVHEYYEKGVSGYKVSAEKREVLQEALVDAKNGKFDVLLVFMFDRLGRREDETPFVVKALADQGVEMWSVIEGQQKFTEHVDTLINFLRFWQADGESKKTSIRVDEKHRQMVENGEYRGGSVPYGYTTVKSGEFTKKGIERKKVVINSEEAKVVQLMFDLVVEKGYGQNRIAKYLNERGILTTKGKRWSASSVGVLLRNPMYKGYLVYARGTDQEVKSKQLIQDLLIIDEDKWERVQSIRTKRKKDKEESPFVIRTTKGELLFVGMIRCGHCGGTLTTTYNTKRYTRKDGTKKVNTSAKYRCGDKAHNKVKCDGQTIYSKKKIEGVVLDEVYRYLEQLKSVDLTSQIQKIKKQNTASERKELRQSKKRLENVQRELSTLKKEVANSLMGKSKFPPELLSDLIMEKEKEVSDLSEKVNLVESELENKKVEFEQMKTLQKYIPKWSEVFEQASTEKKKMMLSTIINGITVYRDKIEIDFKLNISQFIGTMGETAITDRGAVSKDVLGKILSHSSLTSYK